MLYQNKYQNQDLTKFKFSVTLGVGFIATNLIEYLLKYKTKKVIVLDCLSNGQKNIYQFFNILNFKLSENGVGYLNTYKNPILDIDYVLHQVALGSELRSINDPIIFNEVNFNVIHGPNRSGDVKYLLTDILKASLLLRYNPLFLFSEWIKKI